MAGTDTKPYGNYSSYGTEYAKDANGDVMGQYGSGPKGDIHRTHGGYTTLHQDGNNHHHGDHALSGTFSKDGVTSNSRK